MHAVQIAAERAFPEEIRELMFRGFRVAVKAEQFQGKAAPERKRVHLSSAGSVRTVPEDDESLQPDQSKAKSASSARRKKNFFSGTIRNSLSCKTNSFYS